MQKIIQLEDGFYQLGEKVEVIDLRTPIGIQTTKVIVDDRTARETAMRSCTMTKQEKQDHIKRLKNIIDMLNSDIECFGPSVGDMLRIANYEKELKELEADLLSTEQ